MPRKAASRKKLPEAKKRRINTPQTKHPWRACPAGQHYRSGSSVSGYTTESHEIDYCHDFIKEWQKVTKAQDIVCLNGEGGYYEQDPKRGKYKSWAWDKTKTKKGCLSYFANYCDNRYASSNK